MFIMMNNLGRVSQGYLASGGRRGLREYTTTPSHVKFPLQGGTASPANRFIQAAHSSRSPWDYTTAISPQPRLNDPSPLTITFLVRGFFFFEEKRKDLT